MKKSLFMAAVLLLSLCMFTFSACDDNEEDKNVGKPVVALNEVGEENSKTAIAGSDLHLEGEITAENRIKRIDIEIHQEEGGEFRIEKSFTEGKYIGVKNTTFHEHIDIPAEAPAGAYHLHFTVTDQLGQTEMAQSELAVKAAAAHITVEDLKFGASHDFSENKISYVGTKPMVSAHIKAENGIEKIAVFIHNEEGTRAFELDTTYTFNGEKEWGTEGQHKHIVIPDDAPAGDYHMHFNVLNKFTVKAQDDLYSIRLRIYKESAPSEYFFNSTLADEFSKGGLKEYTFNKKLETKDDKGRYATAGEYILELRVEYAQGANKIFKEEFTLAEK